LKSPVNQIGAFAGISDREALFIDSDVQAKLRRPTSHKIFLWKKADLEKLQNDMQAFCQSFISKFSTSHPVDSLWTGLLLIGLWFSSIIMSLTYSLYRLAQVLCTTFLKCL
jgi:hypothetical protein